ncbi:MAG: YciI family protein [Candidatus Zixiibacteriota bacterium]
MPDFMLLFRGGEADHKSPVEMQQIVQKYIARVRGLRESGKYKAGDELPPTGRIVSSGNGRLLDGPFAETKDAVGGYFLIEALNYDEAVAIAGSSRNLANGGSVEIRQISDCT